MKPYVSSFDLIFRFFFFSAMSSKQFFTLIEFRETIENNPYFLEQWFPTGAVPSTDGR